MKLDDHPTVKQYREKAEENLPSVVPEKLDSKWLKTAALEAGGDEVGLVEMDRPELAEQKKDILKVFSGTRTPMSLLCRLNPENVRSVSLGRRLSG